MSSLCAQNSEPFFGAVFRSRFSESFFGAVFSDAKRRDVLPAEDAGLPAQKLVPVRLPGSVSGPAGQPGRGQPWSAGRRLAGLAVGSSVRFAAGSGVGAAGPGTLELGHAELEDPDLAASKLQAPDYNRQSWKLPG